jgi:hypothetical protein
MTYDQPTPSWPADGVQMDVITIVVVSVVAVSFLVGSLTSSVETEKQLPHRY